MTLTLRRKLRMTAMTAMFVLAASGSLRGADEGDPEYVVLRTAELRFVVKDDENRPVAGAEIRPNWVELRESGDTIWPDDDRFEGHKTAISDADGIAVLRYPYLMWHGLGAVTTTSLAVSVFHAEFVYAGYIIPLQNREVDNITLTPGGKAHFTAVDSAGNSVNDFGVIFPDCIGNLWTTPESGGRCSATILAGTWQVMLAKLQDDGPTLFSGVIPLRFTPRKNVIVKNVLLTPGVTLSGKLSSNVPRPVTGHIISVSMPQQVDGKWHGTERPLTWTDWTDIRPDGTFEFQSLPRGGKVQLIGICKQWISVTSFPNVRFGVKGQAFEVEGDRVEVELVMEPTATVEVHVVDEAGQPATEGCVYCAPDQYYINDRIDLFGRLWRSATQVKNQFLPNDRKLPYIDSPVPSHFSVPVDDNGVARISGIPVGRSHRFGLSSERFRLAKNDVVNEYGQFIVEVKSTKSVSVKVTAVPKP